MNGTVAPELASVVEADGGSVVVWDRDKTPIDNPTEVQRFIRLSKADAFFHVATGDPAWAEAVAAYCYELGIPFLFVSSVSVFKGNNGGAIQTDHKPDADDDYGKYKAECEQRVQAVNPDAIIARLGWQIGRWPGGNHMLNFLIEEQKEKGVVEASTRWHPSCCFLEESASALHALMKSGESGIFHVEGNPDCNFFEIATDLDRKLSLGLTIEAKEEPELDNRMADDRVWVRPVRTILEAR